ncbi:MULTISPECIES: CCE_0567 family metalloprotein [unclassified Mesorhizobium]|uniref:CCE_0567 family metalloprotein n=2 Tax=Mesorhizobium TaxID=68287 RepID=UPI0032AF57C3
MISPMSKLDEMGNKVRKLQLRAAVAKMKLRDLAENLPGKWTEIEEVAEETSPFSPSWMVPGESSLQ